MSALKFLTSNNAQDEELFARRGRTGGLVVEGANVLPEDMIYRFLDTTGDGTGTTQATGDYSGAAEDFLITAPSGYEYVLHRMIVKVEDGNSGFAADAYGSLTELTNGVRVRVYNAGGAVALALDGGIAIKSNAQ